MAKGNALAKQPELADSADSLDSILELATSVEKSSGASSQKVDPPSSEGEVVAFADFTPVRLQFASENLTTKMPVKKVPETQFCEFIDRGFVLEMPARSCAKGHHLLIKISSTGRKGKNFSLEVTAKVDKVANHEEGVATVSLDLLQFDELSWKELHDFFESRQTEILDFFSAVRGY